MVDTHGRRAPLFTSRTDPAPRAPVGGARLPFPWGEPPDGPNTARRARSRPACGLLPARPRPARSPGRRRLGGGRPHPRPLRAEGLHRQRRARRPDRPGHVHAPDTPGRGRARRTGGRQQRATALADRAGHRPAGRDPRPRRDPAHRRRQRDGRRGLPLPRAGRRHPAAPHRTAADDGPVRDSAAGRAGPRDGPLRQRRHPPRRHLRTRSCPRAAHHRPLRGARRRQGLQGARPAGEEGRRSRRQGQEGEGGRHHRHRLHLPGDGAAVHGVRDVLSARHPVRLPPRGVRRGHRGGAGSRAATRRRWSSSGWWTVT
ncbi:hypothetical protein SBADM41S_11380 [Streptomyces badius]